MMVVVYRIRFEDLSSDEQDQVTYEGSVLNLRRILPR